MMGERSMKKNTAYLIILTLGVIITIGCSHIKEKKHAQKADLKMDKVIYSYSYGDRYGFEITEITSDLCMKRYIITPDEDSEFNLQDGNLPSEEEYRCEEYQITEGDWNSIVDVISENDIMTIPEDISNSGDVHDGGYSYIEVENNDGSYKVGGYDASGGKEDVNERYYNMEMVISKVIRLTTKK